MQPLGEAGDDEPPPLTTTPPQSSRRVSVSHALMTSATISEPARQPLGTSDASSAAPGESAPAGSADLSHGATYGCDRRSAGW